jgi:hypothetical protein
MLEKKLFFKLYGFFYHDTKLVEKTQKNSLKLEFLVPVPNARKRYPPFS